MSLLRLLRVVRIDPGATTIIHCLAGVGRHYVFIHRCLIEFVKAKKLAKAEILECATQYLNYKGGEQIQNNLIVILRPPDAAAAKQP
uniref:Tyrosine specific protein phosphatases domain-containing protein n=1 Tax=Panagrolaimus sp. ES5 TaxID=591445 RepID=A0AC34GI63_9BILA